MDDELLDWELLHVSDSESTDSISSEKKSRSSSVIDDGMILSDHFSFDKTTDQTQYGVLDSFRENPNQMQNSGEVLVDSSSYHLDDDAADEKQLESEAIAELTGGNLSHYEDASKSFSESDDFEVDNGRQVEDSSKSWSDSGDSEVVNGELEIVSDNGVESTEAIEGSGDGESTVEVVAVNSAVRSVDESNSRETVWWKMPFVILKYYAFKIGPVWSVSMAAAVMGLVLLGRRLYNMKKKAQRFNLKVTIDDKKASRVMNQAARLNEMFTKVRRVPVIRPALPSPGAWPVLTLR